MGSAFKKPKSPKIPPPPPPASYYYYDEDGNLISSQVWDKKRNAYIYSPAPPTPERRLEINKLRELRNQMLANISGKIMPYKIRTESGWEEREAIPEDRSKDYEEYARVMSEFMGKHLDEQYKKMKAAKEEEMYQRGLYGSRAYADTMGELAKEKLEADTDIAQKAFLTKEDLAARDRGWWQSILAHIDSGAASDAALALQRQHQATQASQIGTDAMMNAYNIKAQASLAKWQADLERRKELRNSIIGAAAGLLYLYGLGKPLMASSLMLSKPAAGFGNYNLGNYASRITSMKF
jgi:hypothetical protein